jgi:hypothetical protein
MKIGVGGCSHSSDGFGKPWHYYMGEKLSSDIIESSSSGGSNECNIEKVKYIFEKNPDLDLFILQLTEPSRFSIPILNKLKNDELVLNTTPPNYFKGTTFYTFIGCGNDERIKELTGYDVKFDRFFLKNIYISDFNTKYKFIHTIMDFQYLANHYKKKIIFFSWFVDVKEIANSIGYESIIKEMFILDGYVEKFTNERKINKLRGDSHYGSEEHELIFNEYIYPQIKDKI